jgi:hypothetical protein
VQPDPPVRAELQAHRGALAALIRRWPGSPRRVLKAASAAGPVPWTPTSSRPRQHAWPEARAPPRSPRRSGVPGDALYRHTKGRLNEWWFKEFTDKRLRRGGFTSVADLTSAITTWAAHWSKDPKPFIWKATAADTSPKSRRGRDALNQIKQRRAASWGYLAPTGRGRGLSPFAP